MWKPVISTTRFGSKVHTSDDTEASGKWLVPVHLGDPDGIWEKIMAAAASGELLAVKISSVHLDRILGHHLVCVYCDTSERRAVGQTLRQLRDLGVMGDLQYKSDRATYQRRDEYLWTSTEIEVGFASTQTVEPKPS